MPHPNAIPADPTRSAHSPRDIEHRILDHMELAESIAWRHCRGHNEYADMRQVAYAGLVKAAHRFDPDVRAEFVGYASATISGECKHYLRDHSWSMRPPRSLQDLDYQIAAEIEPLRQRLRREPSTHEIADAIGVPAGAVRAAQGAHQARRATSLDSFDPLSEHVAITTNITGDDLALDWVETVDELDRACSQLSERDQWIVRLRFCEERTQSEIAASLGVTQMQVSRLLQRIIEQLRAALAVETPQLSA
ncbi:sigma-70 family RNA polymerase sigma factor [Demequina sp. SO4-13]|uniref:sigma-70 family RNA polymerase sigma factor n=1 Tax=Demequina sp. SO4-13 TaxID=3401027 RepID=UPI003AF6D650